MRVSLKSPIIFSLPTLDLSGAPKNGFLRRYGNLPSMRPLARSDITSSLSLLQNTKSTSVQYSQAKANNISIDVVEHSTGTNSQTAANQSQSTAQHRPRRPDLSSFFATLNEITPNPSESRARPDAVPVPGDVSAAFRSLAEALDVMRRDAESGGDAPLPVYDGRVPEGLGLGEQEDTDGGLIGQMIRALLQAADQPPREVEGVSEAFCDGM